MNFEKVNQKLTKLSINFMKFISKTKKFSQNHRQKKSLSISFASLKTSISSLTCLFRKKNLTFTTTTETHKIFSSLHVLSHFILVKNAVCELQFLHSPRILVFFYITFAFLPRLCDSIRKDY